MPRLEYKSLVNLGFAWAVFTMNRKGVLLWKVPCAGHHSDPTLRAVPQHEDFVLGHLEHQHLRAC